MAAPPRRSLPLANWPEADRAAWERALCHDDDLLSEAGAGAMLRPTTAANYAFAYGQFLAFLEGIGELVAEETPTQRATPARVGRWRRDTTARGLASTSRRQMLRNLRQAMRLLAPEPDWDRITRPGGVRLKRAIPGGPRRRVMRDPREVLARVRDLGAEAQAMADGPARWRALRDAAVLSVLFTRGPRVSSLAAMTLDLLLPEQADDTQLMRLPPEHTKGKRALEIELNAQTVALLHAYLTQARDRFPRAGATDALWLGMKGRMTVEGLKRICEQNTLRWFGQAHGPHIARHWISHAARRAGPHHARTAAIALGHSEDTAAQHYSQAACLHAARRYAKLINKMGG